MGYQSVLAVDIQSYGSRPGAVQQRLQEGLAACLSAAAAHSRLDPDGWRTQDQGDGRLAVLPPGVAAEELIDRFVRELNAAQRAYNRTAGTDARLRIRVAIHHGPARRGALGHSGSAPVTVTRLRDGGPLRSALDAAGADLGVILSDVVYRWTVAAGDTSLEPGDLRRVLLPELGDEAAAWIWLPGRADLAGLAFADGLDGETTEPSASEPSASEQSDPSASEPPAREHRTDAAPAGRSAFTGANFHGAGGTYIGGDYYDDRRGDR